MKRCRDGETISDKRSGSRNVSASSSSIKEGTTSSSCRTSTESRGHHSEPQQHRDEHGCSSKRERSDERGAGSGRYHGNSRSGGHGTSPNSRGDRISCRRAPQERDRRKSRSHSVEKSRSGKRHSRSRSRDRRSSKDADGSRKPERRSRSRGFSKEKQTKRSKSAERGKRNSGSRSVSPKHSTHGSSNIVVTGPDSKKLTVHIPEPVKKAAGPGREAPSNLPLNDMSTMPIGRLTTPQMAIQQAMAAMSAKAQQMTGVSLPKYYNPAAVNPLKYAEQMQKRKLLWQNKEKVEAKPAPSNNNWEGTAFAQDQDGRMAAKFKRLMGIKKEESLAPPPATQMNIDPMKKQEELFRSLDQQYEQARVSTHTHRGVGLGYSSAMPAAAAAAQFNLFPK